MLLTCTAALHAPAMPGLDVSNRMGPEYSSPPIRLLEDVEEAKVPGMVDWLVGAAALNADCSCSLDT